MVDGWVLKRSERCRTGSNTPGVVEESIEEVVVVVLSCSIRAFTIQSVRCEGTKTVSGAVTGGYGSAMVAPSGSAYLL